MADLCLIDIEDEDGQMRRMAAWHADPDKRALTEELRTSYPPDPAGAHPSIEVMRYGRSMWSADMDDDFLRSTSRDERHYEILKALDFTSYVTVPLRLRDQQVLGTVTLVSAGSGRRFSEKDLGLAEQLAEQVSSVVIRARAYDRERRISHELQRHLLPDAIPADRRVGRGGPLPAGRGRRRGGRRLVRRRADQRAPRRPGRRRRGGPRPRGGADHEPVAPHARAAAAGGAGAGQGPAAIEPRLAGGRRRAPGHRARRRARHQDRVGRIVLRRPSLAGPRRVGLRPSSCPSRPGRPWASSTVTTRITSSSWTGVAW